MAGQSRGMGGAGAECPQGRRKVGRKRKKSGGLFILPIAGQQVCWQKRLQQQQSPCHREQPGHQPPPSTRARWPLVLLPLLEPTTPHQSTGRWKMMLREGSATSCTPKGDGSSGGNMPSLPPSLPPSLTPVPVEEGGRSRA